MFSLTRLLAHVNAAITASATAFSCTLTYRPTQYQTDINNGAGAITSPFPAANIITGILYAGNLYSGGGASPGTAQPVALINSAGLATPAAFKYPLNSASGLPDPSKTPLPEAIVPNDAPVQADAEFLTISSVAGSFPVMDVRSRCCSCRALLALLRRKSRESFLLLLTNQLVFAILCLLQIPIFYQYYLSTLAAVQPLVTISLSPSLHTFRDFRASLLLVCRTLRQQ